MECWYSWYAKSIQKEQYTETHSRARMPQCMNHRTALTPQNYVEETVRHISNKDRSMMSLFLSFTGKPSIAALFSSTQPRPLSYS